MSTIKGMLECNAGLMPEERVALHTLLARPYKSLDEVERCVKAVFPAWFLYRGGSHIALSVRAYSASHGESPRLAVWTVEAPRVDFFEHETLGIDKAIERAYARGRRIANRLAGATDAHDQAQRIAACYGHGRVSSSFLEGFDDQVDESREAACEEADAADAGHGEG